MVEALASGNHRDARVTNELSSTLCKNDTLTNHKVNESLLLLTAIIKKGNDGQGLSGDILAKYARILSEPIGAGIIELLDEYGATTQPELKTKFNLADYEAHRWIRKLTNAGILAKPTEAVSPRGRSGLHSPIYPVINASEKDVYDASERLKESHTSLHLIKSQHPGAYAIAQELKLKLRKAQSISLRDDIFPALNARGIPPPDKGRVANEVAQVLRKEGLTVW